MVSVDVKQHFEVFGAAEDLSLSLSLSTMKTVVKVWQPLESRISQISEDIRQRSWLMNCILSLKTEMSFSLQFN